MLHIRAHVKYTGSDPCYIYGPMLNIRTLCYIYGLYVKYTAYVTYTGLWLNIRAPCYIPLRKIHTWFHIWNFHNYVKSLCGIGTVHIWNFHIWKFHIWNFHMWNQFHLWTVPIALDDFTYEIFIRENIFIYEIFICENNFKTWNPKLLFMFDYL